MTTMRIPGQAAWLAAVKGQAVRWSDDVGRFSQEIANAIHVPKFTIDAADKFFCIGSCFARNIEEHLIYQNINVLSRRIICPKSEWPNRVNGFVNKFTTHSMRNELDWVLHSPGFGSEMFEEQEQGWIDLQLCPGVSPVTLERAVERRMYLTRHYFSRLRDASIVVMTLGLNEVWFDRVAERHLNAAPGFYATRRSPERYELHVTDVKENVAELNSIHQLITELNPCARIIVTVSPVPMSETFSGRDVMIANMYSKSTLRAAAEIFCQAHANVDYFPSYDIIAMTPRHSAFGADCMHVTNPVVGRMMQTFIGLYLRQDHIPVVFNELAYLEANPDVEAAVRQGDFMAGFEHWQLHGHSEGRLLSPLGGPTPLMINAGTV